MGLGPSVRRAFLILPQRIAMAARTPMNRDHRVDHREVLLAGLATELFIFVHSLVRWSPPA
jgi:hypothetical protein